ncbi:Ca2+-binding RTX toxin-like protein [Skermanella aerolata]|uniref:hypothetical protein n=1 Tax=Skermanella aerolata TaxID=393310 RepID=UPI003D2005DF
MLLSATPLPVDPNQLQADLDDVTQFFDGLDAFDALANPLPLIDSNADARAEGGYDFRSLGGLVDLSGLVQDNFVTQLKEIVSPGRAIPTDLATAMTAAARTGGAGESVTFSMVEDAGQDHAYSVTMGLKRTIDAAPFSVGEEGRKLNLAFPDDIKMQVSIDVDLNFRVAFSENGLVALSFPGQPGDGHAIGIKVTEQAELGGRDITLGIMPLTIQERGTGSGFNLPEIDHTDTFQIAFQTTGDNAYGDGSLSSSELHSLTQGTGFASKIGGFTSVSGLPAAGTTDTVMSLQVAMTSGRPAIPGLSVAPTEIELVRDAEGAVSFPLDPSLRPFSTFSASDLAGSFEQLAQVFSRLSDSDLLNTALPMVEGTTVGDLVDFYSGFQSDVVDPLVTIIAPLGFSERQSAVAGDSDTAAVIDGTAVDAGIFTDHPAQFRFLLVVNDAGPTVFTVKNLYDPNPEAEGDEHPVANLAELAALFQAAVTKGAANNAELAKVTVSTNGLGGIRFSAAPSGDPAKLAKLLISSPGGTASFKDIHDFADKLSTALGLSGGGGAVEALNLRYEDGQFRFSLSHTAAIAAVSDLHFAAGFNMDPLVISAASAGSITVGGSVGLVSEIALDMRPLGDGNPISSADELVGLNGGLGIGTADQRAVQADPGLSTDSGLKDLLITLRDGSQIEVEIDGDGSIADLMQAITSAAGDRLNVVLNADSALEIIDRSIPVAGPPDGIGFELGKSRAAEADPLIAEKFTATVTAAAPAAGQSYDYTSELAFVLRLGRLEPVVVTIAAQQGRDASGLAAAINQALSVLDVTQGALGFRAEDDKPLTDRLSFSSLVRAGINPDGTLKLESTVYDAIRAVKGLGDGVTLTADNHDMRLALRSSLTLDAVNFSIMSLNNSQAATILGIGGVSSSPLSAAEAEITGRALHGETIGDRFRVRYADFSYDLDIDITNLTIEKGRAGFVDITATGGTASLDLDGHITVLTDTTGGEPGQTLTALNSQLARNQVDGYLKGELTSGNGAGTPYGTLNFDHVSIVDQASFPVDFTIDGIAVTLSTLDTITDLAQPAAAAAVTMPENYRAILDVDLPQVLAALKSVAGVLAADYSGSLLKEALPLIGQSAASVLDFSKDFSNKLDAIDLSSPASIQTALQQLRSALGLDVTDPAVKFSVDKDTGTLNLDLAYAPLRIDKAVPFTLEIQKFLQMAGDQGLNEALAGVNSIRDVGGVGLIDMFASAMLNIALGIRLGSDVTAATASSATRLSDLNQSRGLRTNGTSAADLRIMSGNGIVFDVDLDTMSVRATNPNLFVTITTDGVSTTANPSVSYSSGKAFGEATLGDLAGLINQAVGAVKASVEMGVSDLALEADLLDGRFQITDGTAIQLGRTAFEDFGFQDRATASNGDLITASKQFDAEELPDLSRALAFSVTVNGNTTDIVIAADTARQTLDQLASAIQASLNGRFVSVAGQSMALGQIVSVSLGANDDSLILTASAAKLGAGGSFDLGAPSSADLTIRSLGGALVAEELGIAGRDANPDGTARTLTGTELFATDMADRFFADASKTSATVGIGAKGEGLNFKTVVGPLGAEIVNGTAFIGAKDPNAPQPGLEGFATADPKSKPGTFTIKLADGDGRLTLAEIAAGQRSALVSVISDIAADVLLPISVRGTPLATPLSLEVTDLFDQSEAGRRIAMISPDIAAFFEGIDYNNDPDALLSGLQAFLRIMEVQAENFFALADLPFLGTNLTTLPSVIAMIRDPLIEAVEDEIYRRLGDELPLVTNEIFDVALAQAFAKLAAKAGLGLDGSISKLKDSADEQEIIYRLDFDYTAFAGKIAVDDSLAIAALNWYVPNASVDALVTVELAFEFGFSAATGFFVAPVLASGSSLPELSIDVDLDFREFKSVYGVGGTLPAFISAVTYGPGATDLLVEFDLDMRPSTGIGAERTDFSDMTRDDQVVGTAHATGGFKMRLEAGIDGKIGSMLPAITSEIQIDGLDYRSTFIGGTLVFDTAAGYDGSGFRSVDVSFNYVRLDIGSLIGDFLAPIMKTVDGILEPIRPFLDFITTPIPGVSTIYSITLLELAEAMGTIDSSTAKWISLIDTIDGIIRAVSDFGDANMVRIEDLGIGGSNALSHKVVEGSTTFFDILGRVDGANWGEAFSFRIAVNGGSYIEIDVAAQSGRSAEEFAAALNAALSARVVASETVGRQAGQTVSLGTLVSAGFTADGKFRLRATAEELGANGTLHIEQDGALEFDLGEATLHNAAVSNKKDWDLLYSKVGEHSESQINFDKWKDNNAEAAKKGQRVMTEINKGEAKSTSGFKGGLDISFPIFTHSKQTAMGLLLGRTDTNLVLFNLPTFEFGVEFSVGAKFYLVPLPVALFVELGLGLKFGVDIDFGYDATGLAKLSRIVVDGGDVGANAAPALMEGFYLADLAPERKGSFVNIAGFGNVVGGPVTYYDKPEIYLEGRIWLSAGIDLVLARGGLTGELKATIGLDFADPNGDGRVRPSEFMSMMQVSPFAMFDVVGAITLRVFAFFWIGLPTPFGDITLIEGEIDIFPETDLFSFTTAEKPDPFLATNSSGTLFINAGTRANERILGNIADGDETFHIRQVGGLDSQGRATIEVTAPGIWNKAQTYTGISRIIADTGLGNDTIILDGVSVDIDINAGVGNDVVRLDGVGIGGNVSSGNSRIRGGLGNDTLIGGSGRDDISDVAGTNSIRGGAGDDTLTGGIGNDTIFGDDGADVIVGGIGNDVIDGGAGNDTIDGGDNDDIISGGTGDDTIDGGTGDDWLFGGNAVISMGPVITITVDGASDGNDLIRGGRGEDIIFGGGGNDTVGYLGTAGFLSDSESPENGNDIILGDGGVVTLTSTRTLISVEAGIGHGVGDDLINGGRGNDIIVGSLGNDNIKAGRGFDIVLGDTGFIDGAGKPGGGYFRIEGIGTAGGNDLIDGSHEDDVLIGGLGNDVIDGAVGADVIGGDNIQVLRSKALGVAAVRLVQSTGDTSGGDDTLTGGVGNDWIVAGIGKDVVDGGSGRDILLGDTGSIDARALDRITVTADGRADGGDDLLYGDVGDDVLLGGGGKDVIRQHGRSTTDLAEDGSDLIAGDGARLEIQPDGTLISFRTHDEAVGGDDSIQAGTGTNMILGGAGADQITAGEGPNVVLGDIGRIVATSGQVTEVATHDPLIGQSDVITLGNGDNVVMGGAGRDIVTSGNGRTIVAGDGARLTLSQTRELASLESIDEAFGDDDTIRVGHGDNTILGGTGADDIEAGNGANVILGDLGLILPAGTSGGDVTARNLTVGGKDKIVAGSGGNVVMGGADDDAITTGSGIDLIAGDGGKLARKGNGSLGRFETVEESVGGNDVIKAGSGNNVVLAGTGADTVTTGSGADILLGDLGMVSGSGSNVEVIARRLATGGKDALDAGNGDNIVMGGAGGDTIRTGSGNDLVAGDGAWLVRGSGGQQVSFQTVEEKTGGDDRIDAGEGQNVVLAGTGADSIKTGAGVDVVLGDLGAYLLTGGTTVEVTARELGTGGRDEIDAGQGDNAVMGGAGGDLILSGDGKSLIAGDGGRLVRTVAGDLVSFETVEEAVGGNDAIRLGNGANTVFGGTGDDDIVAGDGANVILGDLGLVLPAGSPAADVTARNLTVGGKDRIVAGNGGNVVMGGADDDFIQTGGGIDLVAGDGARLSRTPAGELTSFETVEETVGGNDTVDAGGGDDVVLGGTGADTVGTGAGSDIVLGDLGLVASADGLVEVTSRQLGVGGNDVLDAGDGDNVVMGGAADDDIRTGGGMDLIAGDGARLVRGADGRLIRFETVEEEIGGRDRVDAGQGDNVVLGGTGRDDLTAGDGNDVILGDLGTILAVDGVAPDVTARNIGIGDDDIINAGNGDNVVMGGAGNDAITTGSGVDLIAGDGGRLTRNMLGALVRFETVEEDVGGDDAILAGDGNNVVLAGTGADTVATGAGADIVLGDLGLVARDDAGGTQVVGRNIGVGGNDILEAGTGDNVVMGGAGDDAITTGEGTDLIAGDGAQLDLNPTAALVRFETVEEELGGNDRLSAGEGQNIVLGGAGDDAVTTGSDADIVLGDLGMVSISGETVEVAASEVDVGGNDDITAGEGDNIVFGGAGNDTITTGGGADLVAGDGARLVRMAGGALVRFETTGETIGGDDAIDVAEGSNIVLGGIGRDTITAGEGANVLLGDLGVVLPADGIDADVAARSLTLGGDDRITAGSGGNVILGGAGNDTIATGGGADLIAGDGAQLIRTAAGALVRFETLEEETGGDDAITAGDGDNVVLGGAGSDLIDTGVGADIVLGDLGMVSISGETVEVAASEIDVGGNDGITDGEGDNIVFGGAGNDAITTGGGADLVAGDGARLVRMAGGALVRFETTGETIGGDDAIDVAEGSNIVLGGIGSDTITAGEGANVLLGDLGVVLPADGISADVAARSLTLGGDDRITAGGAGNVILGGAGNDTIATGGGADLIAGDAARLVRTAAGALVRFETLEDETGGDDAITAGDGDNVVLGGIGADLIDTGVGAAIILGDLGQITLSSDATEIVAREAALGGNDRILAGEGDNVVLGGAGDDTIATGAGADLIAGDAARLVRTAAGALVRFETLEEETGGNDIVSSGAGDDIVLGGAGSDTLDGEAGSDVLLGDAGLVLAVDGFAADVTARNLAFGGSDTIRGGSGDDVVLGGAVGDSLFGDEGNDLIAGDGAQVLRATGGSLLKIVSVEDDLGGDDFIDGGDGNDVAIGGSGNDEIRGGAGNDILFGDNGTVFYSDDRQVITAATTSGAIGGRDRVFGEAGNDLMIGGTDDDDMEGGAGDDILIGDAGNALLSGFVDPIWVETVSPLVSGAAGRDTLLGGEGMDTILGGALEDYIVAGSGDDVLIGDEGYVGWRNGLVYVTEALRSATGKADYLDSGDGIDLILGGEGANTIIATQGTDFTIRGNGRFDVTEQREARSDLIPLAFVGSSFFPTLGHIFTSRDQADQRFQDALAIDGVMSAVERPGASTARKVVDTGSGSALAGEASDDASPASTILASGSAAAVVLGVIPGQSPDAGGSAPGSAILLAPQIGSPGSGGTPPVQSAAAPSEPSADDAVATAVNGNERQAAAELPGFVMLFDVVDGSVTTDQATGKPKFVMNFDSKVASNPEQEMAA